MGTIQDKDVAIWVCPHGYTQDVVQFPAWRREPVLKGCATHGELYIKRCPNPECPQPTYHPSDLDANFHAPCLAKIPWAEARRGEAELVGYEPFNASLVGHDSSALARDELQDLIVKPSGRLPRASAPAADERSLQAQNDMSHARYLDMATGMTRERPRVVRVAAAERRDEMPTLGPANLDLYVCPKGHEHWMPVPGVQPPRPNCSQCGKDYLSSCPQCAIAYRGIDLEARFHACGAKIPWSGALKKSWRSAAGGTFNQSVDGHPIRPLWQRGLFGLGAFWTAVLIALTAFVIGLFIRTWLIAERMIAP